MTDAWVCPDHPGPLDDAIDHVCRLRPLPGRLEESLILGRCIPVAEVHEWCEHDPNRPPPSFRDLSEARQ